MSTQVSKSQQDPQQLTILYIAAFGANAVGLAAFDAYTDDPMFALISMFVIAAGFYYCWLKRVEPARNNATVNIIRYIIAIMLTLFLVGHVLSKQILFQGTTESGSITMAVLISFVMIAISFYVLSDEILLFSCIPPLSLIGLTGTMGQDESILLYFSAFLILTSLLMIHQNLITVSNRRVRQKHPLGVYAGIALAITVIAIIIGFVSSKLIYEPIDKRILSRLVVPMPFQNPTIQDLNDVIPVGPSPNTSNEELMTVQTDDPYLLRGQTFNYYTGAVWRDNRSFMGEMVAKETNHINSNPGSQPSVLSSFIIPQEISAGIRKSVKKTNQLINITNGNFRLVFAQAEPVKIEFNDDENLYRSVKAIGTSRFRGAGSICKIESLVSAASANELRNAQISYPPDYKTWYLQTPPLEFDIKALSDKICKGKKNPYDKAIAIQNYLEENYTYDLFASMKLGNNDIVSDFLFNTKTGHCTLFASAMVMLSRHAGIPARLATGFNYGDRDERTGLYKITAANKHAWAELFFPDYGWITFDPSAAKVNVGIKERILKALTSISAYLKSRRNVIIVIAIIILLAGYLLKTELLDRLSGKRRTTEELATISKAVANYRRMCAILAKFGFAKDPALTPLEYENQLKQLFGNNLLWLTLLINAVTKDMISVRYAAKSVPDERLNTNEQHIIRLRRDLRSAQKNGAFTNIEEKADGKHE